MIFKVTSLIGETGTTNEIELPESDIYDNSIIINKIHQAGFITDRNENELVVEGQLISVLLITTKKDNPLVELVEVI
jgi:hypothetical protein